jgi:hypothetical protein
MSGKAMASPSPGENKQQARSMCDLFRTVAMCDRWRGLMFCLIDQFSGFNDVTLRRGVRTLVP